MFITKEMLIEKGACQEGIVWFNKHFPEGSDYQDALNIAAQENEFGFAQWGLQQFGSTNAVMEIEEINCEASIFFAGRIVVKGAIKIAKWLLSGSGIEAGEGIKAG